MPTTIQSFLAAAATKACTDLIAAVENLPEDKRGWSPLDKGRTALDQAAECAIMNGLTVNLINSKVFPAEFDFEAFMKQKRELAGDWNDVKSLLVANTASVASTIEGVPDGDLEIEIDMPWGKFTVAQVMSYPFWNMAYHEGQTNYIGFLNA